MNLVQRDNLLSNQEQNLRQNQLSRVEQEQDPDIYSNFSEYIFSLVGYAVGYGTFWRFPYLVYKNGGGAFMIPYLFWIIVISIPMNYLEVAVGQMSRLSQPTLYARINQGFTFLGLTFLVIGFSVGTLLNILLVYTTKYILVLIFESEIKFQNQTIQDNAYFHEQILHKSDSISEYGQLNYVFLIIYVFFMFLVYVILKNGVKSSGKITIITAIMPYVIFSIIAIRGLWLPGAMDGLKQLFVPDFSKLLSFQIWSDGFTQAFFGMGVSQGVTIAISSMKSRKQRVMLGVYILPISVLICGLLCAVIIYMYVGNYCYVNQIAISSLNLQGIQLSFNVFPKILASLPLPRLWLLTFFVALIFLGIDSQFGIIQMVFVYFNDQFKDNNSKIRLFSLTITAGNLKFISVFIFSLMSLFFCSSAGIYYLDYFNNFGCSIPFALGCLSEIIILVHILPFQQTVSQLEAMTNQKVPIWIKTILTSPILVIVLLANLISVLMNQVNQVNVYPTGHYILGWFYSLGPYIVALIYYFVYRQSQSCDSYKKLQHRAQEICQQNQNENSSQQQQQQEQNK